MQAWRQLATEIVSFLRGGIDAKSKQLTKRTVVEESLVEAWERRIKILDAGVADLPRYQHYKGGHYEVITEASLEADPSTQVVVYRNRDTGRVWVRPYNEFHGQAVQGGQLVPRFFRVL